MKTVVTGFGPFGAFSVNASELLVRRLGALALPSVVTAVLPVSHERAGRVVEELFEEHRPSKLILLGLDAAAPALKFEEVARNWDAAPRPDMDGVCRVDCEVVRDAPSEYASTLPLAAMASAAAELDVRLDLSRNAGGYVCNHTFFVTQHLAATRFTDCRTGLVHVPDFSENDAMLARLVTLLERWSAL